MAQVIRWEHVQNVSGLGLKNTYELMWCDQCVGVVWEKSSHSSYAIFGDPRGHYGVGHRPSLDEAKDSAVERAVELGIITVVAMGIGMTEAKFPYAMFGIPREMFCIDSSYSSARADFQAFKEQDNG